MKRIPTYLIDFLIVPLTIFAYYQSLKLTNLLNSGTIYFLFILFIFIHFFSSLIAVISNYFAHGRLKKSLVLIGFGPTLMAFLTLFMIKLLPFLRWPFYIFKWIPFFDFWITPFIMGLSAFFTQVFLNITLSDSLYEIEDKIKNIQQSEKNLTK